MRKYSHVDLGTDLLLLSAESYPITSEIARLAILRTEDTPAHPTSANTGAELTGREVQT